EWDLLPDVPWAHALSVTTAALAGHGGTLWAVLGLAGGVNAREFHTDPAALVAEFTWTDGAAPTAVATRILDDTVYAVTGHEDGTIQRRVISHLTSDEP